MINSDSNNKSVALAVNNVSKNFKIPIDKRFGIKQAVVGFYKRKNRGYRKFEVLKEVSFTVNKGDFFGIVGRNGSGKSTLLKIISNIYKPSEGEVSVNGTLMPFIELGVGFNMELSARENVYLNGAMIGFSREEMDEMYDDIVSFAELHDFMEEQLKNFSSGMKVRLAFSIAIKAKSDILVLDEVLAVGDESFKQKCNEYFNSQMGKRTIILVTHDMGAVNKYCNRGIFLNNGRVEVMGDNSEIADAYSNLFIKEREEEIKNKEKEEKRKDNTKDKEVHSRVFVDEVDIIQEGKKLSNIEAFKDFTVQLGLKLKKDISDAVVAINIIDSRGNILIATSTKSLDENGVSLKSGDNTASFNIENIFTNGDYFVDVAVANSRGELLFKQSRMKSFVISGVKSYAHSITHPKIKIEVS